MPMLYQRSSLYRVSKADSTRGSSKTHAAVSKLTPSLRRLTPGLVRIPFKPHGGTYILTRIHNNVDIHQLAMTAKVIQPRAGGGWRYRLRALAQKVQLTINQLLNA